MSSSNLEHVLDSTFEDGIAILKMNRPDSLNALTQDLCDAIINALQQASEDDTIKVIILTGNGKAFCAGVDLKELSNEGSVLERDGEMIEAFNQCHKPIIGAVNGACVTGGLELALFCDFLYASNNAKFADTHAKVGLLPAWGMSQKLPRIIGIQRAREMSFSGTFIDAETALNWNLVNKVFEPSQLLPETIKIAQKIALNFPATVSIIKQLINDGWHPSINEGIALERSRSVAHNSSIDFSKMQERLEMLRSTK